MWIPRNPEVLLEVPSAAQWTDVWMRLGISAAPEDLFRKLIECYSEPHRRYHTLRHLDDCLEQIVPVRNDAKYPAEIELALWFHDAVYDTKRNDNEERSASWARAVVQEHGLSGAVADRVYELVMATRHAATPPDDDAKLLVDVDLSILGADSDRFNGYEQQIREEYSWVPDFLFRRKRKEILRELLARPTIFSTAHFAERYEQQARANLQRSIERLRGD